MAKQSRI